MAELKKFARVVGRDLYIDPHIARVFWDSSAIIARDQNQFWIPEKLGNVSGYPDLVSRVMLSEDVRGELERIYVKKDKDYLGLIKLSKSPNDIWKEL